MIYTSKQISGFKVCHLFFALFSYFISYFTWCLVLHWSSWEYWATILLKFVGNKKIRLFFLSYYFNLWKDGYFWARIALAPCSKADGEMEEIFVRLSCNEALQRFSVPLGSIGFPRVPWGSLGFLRVGTEFEDCIYIRKNSLGKGPSTYDVRFLGW